MAAGVIHRHQQHGQDPLLLHRAANTSATRGSSSFWESVLLIVFVMSNINALHSSLPGCVPGHAFQLLPHLRYDPTRTKQVPPEFSWINRQTGIIPQWTCSFGFWQHYNVSTLSSSRSAFQNDDGYRSDNKIHNSYNHCPAQGLHDQVLVPYTEGYMKKHLRLINDTAFELWSVYQPSALGTWLQNSNGMLNRHGRADGNTDHSYVFSYRPYRINPNPLPNLPDGSTTRVFLIGPATLHGTMHLPPLLSSAVSSSSPASSLSSSQASRTPVETLSTTTTTTIHRPKSRTTWQFFELWLAEEYLGMQEGRKVGAVVEYNGTSGCLTQVFTIHEIAQGLSKQHPQDDIVWEKEYNLYNSKKQEMNLANDQSIAQNNVAAATGTTTIKRTSSKQSSGLSVLFPTQERIPQTVFCTSTRERRTRERARTASATSKSLLPSVWSGFRSSSSSRRRKSQPMATTQMVHLVNGYMGPEEMTVHAVKGPLMDTSSGLDPSLFHTLHLANGAYLKIPKCFNTKLNNTICIEFGCRRLDGDCHRLVVYGNRQPQDEVGEEDGDEEFPRQGCYHTICYDRWSD